MIVDGVRTMVCQARGGYPTDDDPALVELIEQLELIAAAHDSQLTRLEAAFLVLAEQLAACTALGQLPGALRQLVDALLPAQLEARNRRGQLDRGATLTRKPDGSGWRLQADLDLETGELAHAVLDAELRRDPDAPDDTERAARLREQGLDPHDPGLRLPDSTRPRSRRERLHDALNRVLGRYLAADLAGSHDKSPVHVVTTVPAGTLDGQPGSLPAVGGSGATLPVSLVRRWACGSALTRLIVTLSGKVIEASHTERTLKPHERRALHALTGGTCQAAGCTRSTRQPGTIMHPHHADPWASSGTTSLADTVLICDTDHGDLHHGNILTLKDGRRLGPDGWLG